MPTLTGVRSFVIKTEPPHKGGMHWYFLKLETDDGLEGWGETAVLSCFRGLESSYDSLIKEIFDAHLKGENALDR